MDILVFGGGPLRGNGAVSGLFRPGQGLHAFPVGRTNIHGGFGSQVLFRNSTRIPVFSYTQGGEFQKRAGNPGRAVEGFRNAVGAGESRPAW